MEATQAILQAYVAVVVASGIGRDLELSERQNGMLGFDLAQVRFQWRIGRELAAQYRQRGAKDKGDAMSQKITASRSGWN